MRKYDYQELLNSRTPQQLTKALEIQGRVLREREQARRHYKAKEQRFLQKLIFRCKTAAV